MSPRVTVQMEGGGVIAVKTAATPGEIAALAYEAGLLRRISHPGVVEVIGHDASDEAAHLRTHHAGESLDTWRGNLQQAGGLVAAVAATLADLHGLGVVHGRLDASHILIGSDGRPRLCGLSPPPDGSTAADDVAGLGRVLEQLVERTSEEGSRLLRWHNAELHQRRDLALRIAHATDPSPSRRPSARALARSILAAIPDAELAAQAPSDQPPDEVFGDQTSADLTDVFINRPWHGDEEANEPSRERVRGVVGVSVFVVLAIATLGVMIRSSRATELVEADPPRTAPSTTSAPSTTTPTTPTTRGVVEVDGQRWTVGQPGDAITMGDWDCDGVATPAVYRPSSGAVFVFSSWSDGDQSVSVQPVAHVPDGRGIRTTAASEPGCELPEVELMDGDHRLVDL